jgi:triacylglycerol esterase/lipase EstA (alpha/beta hydrolase family)
VDKATNILLMIHGIIGDTVGMVQCLKTVLDEKGTTADNKVDLVLAFDYENLNTSIEETAKDLKEKLAAIGLMEGHEKNLVIAAHSMGGLVSRWFIEKLGGGKVVSHLVMYGTPNNGTPWVDVRDMAQAIITYGVNGAAFLQPWLFVLSAVGKLVNGAQVAFKEMDAETGIYKILNDGKTDPGIGYTIVAGNTQSIVPDNAKIASLISRIFAKAKSGSYKLLDATLFKKPNDIAVSVDSIQQIQGSEKWKLKPVIYTVACDHLNYFITREALKHLQGDNSPKEIVPEPAFA